jgi:hypothetical protein
MRPNASSRPPVFPRICAGGCLLGLLGCAPPSGGARLLLEPESTITDGIPAGDGLDAIVDGWSVSFSKYVVAVGPVELRSRESESHATDPLRLIIDLRQLPSQGVPLWTLSGLTEGRYDLFFGTTGSDREQHEGVSDDDFERMESSNLTHLITGTLEQTAGVSCPPAALAVVPSDAEVVGENGAHDPCYAAPSLRFSIEARAEVNYGPCAIDGLPGLAVQGGEVTTKAITLHGDHMFFGGFPEGAEGEVRRYAQWLADCDLDQSGTVTSEELAMIQPSALAEFDERFPLGGSPLRPIDDMLTYVESQLSTQGHFEGEGECAIAL